MKSMQAILVFALLYNPCSAQSSPLSQQAIRVETTLSFLRLFDTDACDITLLNEEESIIRVIRYSQNPRKGSPHLYMDINLSQYTFEETNQGWSFKTNSSIEEKKGLEISGSRRSMRYRRTNKTLLFQNVPNGFKGHLPNKATHFVCPMSKTSVDKNCEDCISQRLKMTYE